MVKFGFVSFVLGSIALPAVAFDNLEEMPESWCLTYLSTYLVTISAAASSPTKGQFPSIESSASSDASIVFNPSSLNFPEETSFAISMTTIAIESAPPSSTTNPSTESEPIVLRIVLQDCQDGVETSSVIATNSEAEQIPSVSSSGPIISASSSSESATPEITTRPEAAVTTQPNGVVTTHNPIIVSNPSSTFQWSNISASFEPPPRTSKSSLIHFSPSIFTSGSSTSIEADSTTEVIEPQLSTTEGLTSTDALPTSEIGTSTEETSTADLEPTTETASIETTVYTTTTTTTTELTTFPTTQETTTAELTTTQETTKDTTTAETIDTNTEELTENPTSTILTSALDSTTETTTEAAMTTTTESSAQIVCPSNPQQCISTFQIQCDTVIGGIPLSSGSSTLEECAQACFTDPSCVIFTHSGSQCFSTSDSSDNSGSFALQDWYGIDLEIY
ncbi:hypothetical protein FG05_06036 [Fusarium graminearum]|nr:hypothetical protein FG05_06036 [Fusarium graminearum]